LRHRPRSAPGDHGDQFSFNKEQIIAAKERKQPRMDANGRIATLFAFIRVLIFVSIRGWFSLRSVIFCGYSGFFTMSSTAGSNQLQAWDDKISALTQRILALYEPTEFGVLRQLSDQSGAAASTQISPALREAVTTVCDALILNLRLVSKINEAKELHAKPVRLFQNPPDAEIAEILTQPVIPIDPAELQNPVHFQLAARKYTLAEIYSLLDARLDPAAAVLTEATRKLRDNQQFLLTAEDQLKRNRDSLMQAGLDEDALLGLLQMEVHSSCERLAKEPLSETLRVEVQNGLTNFETEVQERVREVRWLAQLQNEATQLDAELQEKSGQAQRIFDDRLERVQVHSVAYPPLPEEDIKNLADRLRSLLKPTESRREAIALLQAWLAAAKSALEKTEKSLQKNKEYLDLRVELRGLLSALTVKASALTRAEDREISGMLNQAHRELYRRPSPIELARELLSQVERALNQVNPTD
jgi:hypothetical protein